MMVNLKARVLENQICNKKHKISSGNFIKVNKKHDISPENYPAKRKTKPPRIRQTTQKHEIS
jgi:hypothetical protein